MRDSGFTLLELLIVVAIIGILAAIAIPGYASYRMRSHNATAESDLRNALAGQETSYVDRDAYWDCMNAGCEAALPGYKRSAGVSIMCTPRAAGEIYQCSASHEKGDRTYFFDSENNSSWEVE